MGTLNPQSRAWDIVGAQYMCKQRKGVFKNPIQEKQTHEVLTCGRWVVGWAREGGTLAICGNKLLRRDA